MGADGRDWVVLTELRSTRITRILTCLEGEERQGVFEAALRVQAGLERRDYGALLAALDPNDGRIVHGTDLIEKSILAMLYDIKFENPGKEEFKATIGSHRKKIEEIAGAVARARSLDVMADRSMPNVHDQLVDYVSRIALNRPIMTGDPQFWRWIEESHPGVDCLLKCDEERRMSKANSFVQMLSVQFKHKERSKNHMNQVNSTCQWILDACDGGTVAKYAQKLSDSYDSAITEMRLHVILAGTFQGVEAEKKIPKSCKNTDLSLEHEGDRYLVEVYTSRNFTFVGSQSKFQLDFRKEWKRLFGKSQIGDLVKARVPAVFVLYVGHSCLDRVETQTPAFRDHVCGTMPETSEVVIIRDRDDIEVISVRGGKAVETTALGRELGSAIGRGWH